MRTCGRVDLVGPFLHVPSANLSHGLSPNTQAPEPQPGHACGYLSDLNGIGFFSTVRTNNCFPVCSLFTPTGSKSAAVDDCMLNNSRRCCSHLVQE